MHPVLALALLIVLGVFGVREALAGGSSSVTSGCFSGAIPAADDSSYGELQNVVAWSGLGSLPAGARVDVRGFQEPSASWSDATPSAPAHGVRSSTAVNAGYEIRWWSSALDHQAADLFVFTRASDAVRYVSLAASARCRPHAVAYRLSQPAGSQALLWRNPDGVHEADVFFSRGSHAYRLVEVPPSTYAQGSIRFNDQELIGMAQLLGCRLKQADCEVPSGRSALSPAGYDALKTLTAAVSRLGFEPSVAAPGLISPACVTIGRFSDPEARLVYEECQVMVHFLDVAVYALGCYRGHLCQQWAIGAAAGDLHRAAAIEHQLAAQLATGACRAAWAGLGTTDDRLAHSFLLYGRASAARDRMARRREQIRAGLLDQEAERHDVSPLRILFSCAPHGASLEPPRVA